MGAQDFSVRSKGKTAKEAFHAAVEQARYDYGHAGYTGTIAEKNNYVLLSTPTGKDPAQYADELLDADDRRVSDKWGPAGCLQIDADTWLFFGLASS